MNPYDEDDVYDDTYNDEPTATDDPPIKKSKVIAAVLVLVLLIAGAVYFFTQRGGDEEIDATGEYTPMDILISSQEDAKERDEAAAEPGEEKPAEDIPTPTLQVPEPDPAIVPEGTSQQNLVAPQEVAPPASPEEVNPSTPVGITVTSDTGEVTAEIVPVGHIGPSDAATLAPPEDISQIGWYNASAKPGEDGNGTIVMTGHVNYDGLVGFASLFTHMTPGDIVSITTEDGNVHEYQVNQEVYQVPKTLDEEYVEMTKDTLQRASGPEALVLLTCGGEFDPNSPLGYQDNMIVVAEPI